MLRQGLVGGCLLLTVQLLDFSPNVLAGHARLAELGESGLGGIPKNFKRCPNGGFVDGGCPKSSKIRQFWYWNPWFWGSRIPRNPQIWPIFRITAINRFKARVQGPHLLHFFTIYIHPVLLVRSEIAESHGATASITGCRVKVKASKCLGLT